MPDRINTAATKLKRCHWVRDDTGMTTLIPGCWPRVHDPDADCTCGEWSEDVAREKINAMKATITRLQAENQNLRNLGRPKIIVYTEGMADGGRVLSARQRRRAMHRSITEAGEP